MLGTGHTLLLDVAAGDGGFVLGRVDDAGIDDVSVGGNVYFHTNLAFLVHGGVDVVDHTTMTGAIADTAAASAAFSRTKAGACTTADTTSGTATAAATAATVIHPRQPAGQALPRNDRR